MNNLVFSLKISRYFLVAFCVLGLFSCAKNEDEFARQRQQLRRNNPINVTQEDPINYYYQDPGIRNGGYGNPYTVPAPYYQQVVPAYSPGAYQVPASRFYSNPYAIPPSSVAPRYDIDQYYVAPRGYRNIERPQRALDSSGFDKN